MNVLDRVKTLVSNWRVRRLVRSHVAALRDWQKGEETETERLRGKWHCGVCAWEGDDADLDTATWELEQVRGVTPAHLEQVADCPNCGRHTARLGGDPGRPIPQDYPLAAAEGRGPCPACGSKATIPIIRGYPTNEGMLAASRGRAKLGGCVITLQEDGSGPACNSCKKCGHEWWRFAHLGSLLGGDMLVLSTAFNVTPVRYPPRVTVAQSGQCRPHAASVRHHGAE